MWSSNAAIRQSGHRTAEGERLTRIMADHNTPGVFNELMTARELIRELGVLASGIVHAASRVDKVRVQEIASPPPEMNAAV